MEAIRVCGLVLRHARQEQWIWIQVHTDDKGAARTVCIGKIPLAPSAFDAIPPFPLHVHENTVIRVEVWVSAGMDAAFVESIGACCINAAAWTEADAPVRWYELGQLVPNTSSTEHAQHQSAYRESTPGSDDTGTYLGIAAVFLRCETLPTPREELVNTTNNPSNFHFVVPHKIIRQRALLRRLRVGEVTQQCQVGVLEQLLATTLYGQLDDGSSPYSLDHELQKALVLLQLACQYAFHSTNELERYSGDLEERVSSRLYHKNNLQRRRVNLEQRRSTLAHERDALNSSLGSLKRVLRELETIKSDGVATDQVN